MTEHTDNNLDKILKRVQNLLAKADDPAATKPEADAFRAKAEALMIQYRIEEVTAKPDAEHTAVRFCTSWATRDEDVDALLADIASL